jgi:hypothetical protein
MTVTVTDNSPPVTASTNPRKTGVIDVGAYEKQ